MSDIGQISWTNAKTKCANWFMANDFPKTERFLSNPEAAYIPVAQT
jgi:hypothetical protein